MGAWVDCCGRSLVFMFVLAAHLLCGRTWQDEIGQHEDYSFYDLDEEVVSQRPLAWLFATLPARSRISNPKSALKNATWAESMVGPSGQALVRPSDLLIGDARGHRCAGWVALWCRGRGRFPTLLSVRAGINQSTATSAMASAMYSKPCWLRGKSSRRSLSGGPCLRAA